MIGIGLAIAYILAVGAQKDQIVIGILAVSACIAVARPATGLAMLALISPMLEPNILVPIRFNAVLVAATLLGCILRLPIDRLRLKIHPGLVLLIGYVVFSAISLPSIVSGYPPDWTAAGARELGRLMTGVGLFLSAVYLFKLMPSRAILGLALVAATLVALLAIGAILGSVPFEGLTRGLVFETDGLRASGAFTDPNYLGLYLGPAAVFAVALLRVVRPALKLLLLPTVVLLWAGLALSYSRGAYIGAFAGVIALVWMRNRAAAFVILAIGIVVALLLYPAFQEARFGQPLSIDSRLDVAASDDSRRAVIVAALAMFASNPIFGVGYGMFPFLSPLYSGTAAVYAVYSHNQYLSVLAEQGIVGLGMVAGILAFGAIALRRSRSPLRQAAMAMGVAFLVTAFFLHSAMAFQSSCLIWLVMAATLSPGPRRTDRSLEA